MGDTTSPVPETESPLSRWSRLKRSHVSEKNIVPNNDENRVSITNDTAISASAVAENVTPSDASSAEKTALTDAPLPSLADIALDRDFTPFMQAKVPEALKRQALKALFRDAHFNTMDGLDTYVDDYTKFEPITAEEMAGLSSWKSIMKPLEQVVTPGGYAVDVESEEGRAVLAAREALANEADESKSVVQDSTQFANEADLVREDLPQTISLPHERYGKRVGDFKSDYAPLSVEENALAAQTNSSPAKFIADDPR